jgi:hypothetical protein
MRLTQQVEKFHARQVHVEKHVVGRLRGRREAPGLVQGVDEGLRVAGLQEAA